MELTGGYLSPIWQEKQEELFQKILNDFHANIVTSLESGCYPADNVCVRLYGLSPEKRSKLLDEIFKSANSIAVSPSTANKYINVESLTHNFTDILDYGNYTIVVGICDLIIDHQIKNVSVKN